MNGYPDFGGLFANGQVRRGAAKSCFPYMAGVWLAGPRRRASADPGAVPCGGVDSGRDEDLRLQRIAPGDEVNVTLAGHDSWAGPDPVQLHQRLERRDDLLVKVGMRVRVTEGKGQRERIVPVSPRFFASVADYLSEERPKTVDIPIRAPRQRHHW